MTFKPIPDYPSYFASETGVIGRTLPNGDIRHLSPYCDKQSGGYLKIKLYKEGKRKTFTVSRLVALAFLGLPPGKRFDASHLDGNLTNNKVVNLAWEPRSINNRRMWMNRR